MNASLDLATLRSLSAGRERVDTACPLCGPHCRTAANRKREVLRIWDDGVLVTYKCARCEVSGWAREDRADGSAPRLVAKPREPAADKFDLARFLWSQSLPLAGALAETYLRSRQCFIASESLRLQGDFERKRYVNPTLMKDVIASLHYHGKVKNWSIARNVDGRHCDLDWPRYGLARIQWEGPWSQPGMNPRWGYRHTHWVGAARKTETIGVFDINCMQNGSGWVDLLDWQEMVVPWILKNCVPRANGKWHITHAIEVAL